MPKKGLLHDCCGSKWYLALALEGEVVGDVLRERHRRLNDLCTLLYRAAWRNEPGKPQQSRHVASYKRVFWSFWLEVLVGTCRVSDAFIDYLACACM